MNPCVKNCDVIVQYTTPTIEIVFNTVDPATITEAYLVFKYGGTAILSKSLSSAVVDEKMLIWTLSQADTKALPLGKTVRVYCDWKLTDGKRGRSKYAEYLIVETGKEEVM